MGLIKLLALFALLLFIWLVKIEGEQGFARVDDALVSIEHVQDSHANAIKLNRTDMEFRQAQMTLLLLRAEDRMDDLEGELKALEQRQEILWSVEEPWSVK